MQHDVLLITLWYCCILDRPIRRTVQDSERTTAINVKEKKSILRTVKRACISHNKPFTINTPNLLPTVWCTSALVATSLLKKHCICSSIWNSGGLTKQIMTWREKNIDMAENSAGLTKQTRMEFTLECTFSPSHILVSPWQRHDERHDDTRQKVWAKSMRLNLVPWATIFLVCARNVPSFALSGRLHCHKKTKSLFNAECCACCLLTAFFTLMERHKNIETYQKVLFYSTSTILLFNCTRLSWEHIMDIIPIVIRCYRLVDGHCS